MQQHRTRANELLRSATYKPLTSQQFRAGIDRYFGAITQTAKKDVLFGTTTTNDLLYVPGKWLGIDPDHREDVTHIMIQAPPGHGKTSLVRHLYRQLAAQQVAIWVDDPKHDFLPALEEDSAALGLDDQVTIIDTSDPRRTPSLYSFKRNGMPVEDQALWFLMGLRMAHRQDSWDQTPLRPRWLFNATVPVMELEGSLHDLRALLTPELSAVRDRVINRTQNPLVRDEWQIYEGYSRRERESATLSSLNWIHELCRSPVVERILAPHSHPLPIGDLLCQGYKILSSFPRFRTLSEDTANFMRSNLLQQILAYAFHIPLGKRPPLWLILDEAEHVLSRDSGAIATILAEGRSLGIHLCLLFHSFSQVRAHNPELLPLLLTTCKTKIIGGALYHDDLVALVNEMFITEWHPHIVRDEIYSLEVEPIEETRVSRSFSRSRSIGKGQSISESVATGVSGAIAMGRSFAETFGVSDAWSAAHSTGRNASVTASRQNSRARNWQEGSSLTLSDSWGETDAEGDQWGTADTEMFSSGLGGATTTMTSAGTGTMYPQEFEGDRLGDIVRASEHEGTGRADSHTYTDGYTSGTVDSRGRSTLKARSTGGAIARGTNVSAGGSEGAAEGLAAQLGTSINDTQSFGRTQSAGVQQGTNTTETTTRSQQQQTGTTISGSEEEGWIESINISPFHRLVKRWKVSSREFLSLQDFLATKLITVKDLLRQHFAIKGPVGKALWFKVVTVSPLPGGRERLPEFWRTVFSKPWFQEPIQREAATPLLLQEAAAQEGEPKLVYSQPRRRRKTKKKQ